MLVYRTEEPFAGMKRHPVEILGRGQQFVAYAIHQITGQPYQWPMDHLCDVPADWLPELTQAEAQAFLEEAEKIIPDHLKKTALKIYRRDGVAERVPAGDLGGTPEAIAAAMDHIPNNDLNYDDWVRIGMALKGAVGDSGRELFEAWSARSAKNVPATTAKAWASFNPTRIGAGTIYELAQNYGWYPDSSLILNGRMAELAAQPHPAQPLLDRIMRGEIKANPDAVDPDPYYDPNAEPNHDPEPVTPVNLPYGIFDLDGVMGEFVDWILRTSISPQPKLALGAALACIGALAGRRYRSPTGLRTNIYAIGVADSGGGKDHPRKCVKTALAAAGLTRFHGGDRIASGQGLVSAIATHPALLFQLDEFGHVIQKLLQGGPGSSHIAEIWHVLTELFTSADNVYLGTEFADKKNRPRQDIFNPHVCVFGTTVPGPLWKALESGQVGDGSIARFLIFETDHNYPDRNKAPAPIDQVPERLVEGLKLIASSGGDGNLNDVMLSGVAQPPLPVPCSREAEQILEELSDAQTTRLREVEGSAHTSIIARLWEHTVKVAMIRAISYNPVQPRIEAQHVLWARELVWHCMTALLNAIEEQVADTPYEAAKKKVLAVIRSGGNEGVTGSELARAKGISGLRARERTEILEDLKAQDLIIDEVLRLSDNPKPIHVFRANA